MNTTEIFLIAMLIIFAVPWLVWRSGRTDTTRRWWWCRSSAASCWGPGVLGAAFPDYYAFVFRPR
jgi:hypothetical protein